MCHPLTGGSRTDGNCCTSTDNDAEHIHAQEAFGIKKTCANGISVHTSGACART